MKKYVYILIINLSVFLALLSILGANWFILTFDSLSFDQIIFHLKVPMDGSNSTFLLDFIRDPLFKALATYITILVTYFIAVRFNRFFNGRYEINKNYLSLIVIGSLLFSLNYSIKAIGIPEYIKNSLESSTFYDEYYVKAESELISFPNQKRNLIYIYLESFESTFTSIDLGGSLPENTIDKISDLAQQHIHFSDRENIGGAIPANGTGWTVAGMVAQTSGIHLNIPIQGNSYGAFKYFLPGVISIGEILEAEGYNQTLFIGSDASFGGRRNYFTQHGNYDIKDYYYAKEMEYIPEDYLVWWGYEDEKLFEFAKKELLEIGNSNEPFNFTMLTADTHHIGGYVTEGMETPFDEQYKNVIFNSSKQLHDFIKWIQEQDFYDNTTIVVSGDHLTMDAGFIERNVSQDYNRRIFNMIINSAVETNNMQNREFATFDFFPTTLASLGVKIQGERLGIGTNLFSNKPTLFEELGYDFVNSELSKKSNYYSKNIIQIGKK